MSLKAHRGTLLVTGAGGFVGARFVESCNKLKIPVISVDDPRYFQERHSSSGIDFGRIIDRESLFEELDKPGVWGGLNIAGIVHLGACTDTTELDVDYLNRMNLEYSKKLWNLAVQRKVALVYASSAATYGAGEHGYDDNEEVIGRLKPLNPYGQSKQDFDVWALSEERRGHTPPAWSSFKFFNVYGYGERHKGKMASVIMHSFDQIQKNGYVNLFKSHRDGIDHGHQKRDFIFVDDVIHALHFAMAKPIVRGIYNLGSGTARTFLDLTKAVFKELDRPEDIRFIDTPLEIRERYQYFTEAKMEKLILEGYPKPFTTLEEGVQSYVKRLTQ